MKMNNKPYDLRLDIPARAFINSMIIESIQNHSSFNDIKKDIIKELSLNDEEINSYNLFDQSWIASLLYCLIVVPKEIMKLPENDMLFHELDRMQPSTTSYFTSFIIHDATIKNNTYWIIRLLRNSVSHTLYKIDAGNNWDFWTDKPPKFTASIKRDELVGLLQVYGRAIADRMLKLKVEQLKS